jgi:hypothetical protein
MIKARFVSIAASGEAEKAAEKPAQAKAAKRPSTVRWSYDGQRGKSAMTSTAPDGTVYRIEGSGSAWMSTETAPDAKKPVVPRDRVAALLEQAAQQAQAAQPENRRSPGCGAGLATQAADSASDQASATA